MKNAKLSTRAYKRTTGFVENSEEVSRLENNFFRSIVNDYVRAEVRFNMQREWRELFSNFCVDIGQVNVFFVKYTGLFLCKIPSILIFSFE